MLFFFVSCYMFPLLSNTEHELIISGVRMVGMILMSEICECSSGQWTICTIPLIKKLKHTLPLKERDIHKLKGNRTST